MAITRAHSTIITSPNIHNMATRAPFLAGAAYLPTASEGSLVASDALVVRRFKNSEVAMAFREKLGPYRTHIYSHGVPMRDPTKDVSIF